MKKVLCEDSCNLCNKRTCGKYNLMSSITNLNNVMRPINPIRMNIAECFKRFLLNLPVSYKFTKNGNLRAREASCFRRNQGHSSGKFNKNVGF